MLMQLYQFQKKIKRDIYNRYNTQVSYIPNGIPSLERGEQRRSIPYILFLSRLVPEKGIHTLISAFKRINFQGELYIVGSATHTEKYVEKLHKLASDDQRIKFLGSKYGQEKSDLLTNALLFVLPSTIEGMPIVLLEAMSFGTPCLVSDIQENIDVINVNGKKIAYSFESGNETDLSEQLQKLVLDSNIRVRGANAKSQVGLLYDWDKISSQTREIYNTLSRK